MTLAQSVPSQFKGALCEFAESLRANFASFIPANPEDQLKPPVQKLLQSVASYVQTRSETQVKGLGARPDIGVGVRQLLCGFVELKAPGKGARTNRLSGADKKQWEKFKSLPNLIYTDAVEWALYRSGKAEGQVFKFSGDIIADGAKAIKDEDAAKLHTLLLDFLNWQPIVPNTPRVSEPARAALPVVARRRFSGGEPRGFEPRAASSRMTRLSFSRSRCRTIRRCLRADAHLRLAARPS